MSLVDDNSDVCVGGVPWFVLLNYSSSVYI